MIRWRKIILLGLVMALISYFPRVALATKPQINFPPSSPRPILTDRPVVLLTDQEMSRLVGEGPLKWAIYRAVGTAASAFTVYLICRQLSKTSFKYKDAVIAVAAAVISDLIPNLARRYADRAWPK